MLTSLYICHSICIYAIVWRIYLPYEIVIISENQNYIIFQLAVCMAYIQFVIFYILSYLSFFFSSLFPKYAYKVQLFIGWMPDKFWISVNKCQDQNRWVVKKINTAKLQIYFKNTTFCKIYLYFFLWLSTNSILSTVKYVLLLFNSLLRV